MGSILDQLQKDFDGWGTACDADGLLARMMDDLGAKEFSIENTRIVFSVCPDDINRLHERRTIEGVLSGKWNGDFHLGSLAAYPVSGVTGIAAASHHAPDRHVGNACVEGNLLFFASAHVGFMPGEHVKYGKILRPGQERETTCCGAMMGFLALLKDRKSCSNLDLDLNDPLDIARQVVFCELAKHHGPALDALLAIADGNKQVIELAKINNDLVEGAIKRMVAAFLGRGHCENRIALVSGITINAPAEDYFVLREISVLKG